MDGFLPLWKALFLVPAFISEIPSCLFDCCRPESVFMIECDPRYACLLYVQYCMCVSVSVCRAEQTQLIHHPCYLLK